MARGLSLEEIENGKNRFLRSVQRQYFSHEVKLLKKNKGIPASSKLYKLKLFLGHYGLLRLEGRLQFSDLPFCVKTPYHSVSLCHVSELLVCLT